MNFPSFSYFRWLESGPAATPFQIMKQEDITCSIIRNIHYIAQVKKKNIKLKIVFFCM